MRAPYRGLSLDANLVLRIDADLRPAHHPLVTRSIDTRLLAGVTSGHLQKLQGRRSFRQEHCQLWTTR